MVAWKDRELLAEHPVARAHDADEAHEAVSRLYLPHRMEVLERKPRFAMRLNAIRIGAVTAGYLRYGSDVRLFTEHANDFHINIPVTGTCEQRCGSAEPFRSGPDRAALFLPGYPADLRWRADCAQLCLMIDRREVELELERRLGRPLGRPVRFANAIDLRTPVMQSWLAVLDLVEREAARPDGIAQHPLGAAHLQGLVIAGLLLAQPHNYSELLAATARPAPSKAVRRAVELIEADPGRPWSAALLAAEVAVSLRTLQEGFQRSYELSPMAYLREVRLNRVHDELCSGAPETVTITATAARWGFFHPGRFAAAYQRKFGRLPSETLRG